MKIEYEVLDKEALKWQKEEEKEISNEFYKFVKNKGDTYYTEEEYKAIGLPSQTRIITGYSKLNEEKIMMIPSIEKMNGTLSLKNINNKSPEEQLKAYRQAIQYFEKAIKLVTNA